MRATTTSVLAWSFVLIAFVGLPLAVAVLTAANYPAIAAGIGAAVLCGVANTFRVIRRAAAHQALARERAITARARTNRPSALALGERNRNLLTLADSIIDKHAAALTLQRQRLTVRTGDGRADESQWLTAADLFIDAVIEASGCMIKSSPALLKSVRQKIDQATSRFAVPATTGSTEADPMEYERMVAAGLTGLGWKTHLARGGDDRDIEIIAEMRGKRVVVQCRRYKPSTGQSVVQEAHAARSFAHADHAAVVSDAGFSRAGRQLAQSLGVILLHHDALTQLEPRIFGTITVHPGVRVVGDRAAPANQNAILDMTPSAYEQAVAYGLRCIGWQTRLTRPGEDQHADVVAEMRGRRVIVQCPGFVAPIRASVVQDLDDARVRAGASHAAIVSNAEFTASARDLATLIGVVLLRHDNLTQLEALIFGAAQSASDAPVSGPAVTQPADPKILAA